MTIAPRAKKPRSPPSRRSRVLGVLPGKAGKVIRLGGELLEQRLGLFPGSFERSIAGALVGLDQDVAGAPLLALAEALRVGVVLLADIGIGHTQLIGDGILAQHDVLGLQLGRHLEALALGIVEFACGILRKLHPGGELGCRKADFTDGTLLELNQAHT